MTTKRNMIVVVAKRVDYTRTPEEVIRAIGGRVEYVDWNVAATMPRRRQGVLENVEVVFLRLDRYERMSEADRDYEELGLEPDPYAQAAVNEQDSVFADEHPNCCLWASDDSFVSYLTFDRDLDLRYVYCLRGVLARYDRLWSLWSAGVRRSSLPAAKK